MMRKWQHKGAFVIQFQDETDVEAERFSGRIEHVESSRAMQFSSLQEMLIFLNQVLKEVGADNQGED